ncbi:MAG: DNA mismatch repair ATPase msh1 [Bogoriella megaspora]|nr:MAG: DNA mismatch repair ATPase msh1 [Bogoriella megaspora]
MEYPPMIQQAANNMRKYDDCVVLTRVGNFYELYFDHAEEYGPLLNLKVSRKKTNVGDVPMEYPKAGFQHQYILKYLRILVMDLHKHVAISEEIPINPADRVKSNGLQFDRQVNRVVTAGTLIDEDFLDPESNNYLLAIHSQPGPSGSSDRLGLAWIDISSSTFYVQSIPVSSLLSSLARISPSEIVLDRTFQDDPNHPVQKLLKDAEYAISFHEMVEIDVHVNSWSSLFERPLTEEEAEKLSSEEIAAAGSALQYVSGRLQRSQIKLQPPVSQHPGAFMSIDRYSIKALELTSTLRDGVSKGSLLHMIQETTTKSGARLLRNRLLWPSVALSLIDARLDLVEIFHKNQGVRNAIQSSLQRTFDLTRLLTKFSYGRGDADDLLRLSRTIVLTSDINDTLHAAFVNAQATDDLDKKCHASVLDLLERFDVDSPQALASMIADAIDEEELSQQHQAGVGASPENTVAGLGNVSNLPSPVTGEALEDEDSPTARSDSKAEADSARDDIWVMKHSASTILQNLHWNLDQLYEKKQGLTSELKQKLVKTGVALKWSAGFGHYCHVKGALGRAKLEQLRLEGARTVSSSKSTISFYYEPWTHLGREMDSIRLRIREEEQKVFNELRSKTIGILAILRGNASVLDDLDVACSCATVATKHNWVRPKLNNSASQTIIGGRHPMVNLGLSEKGAGFTSNDCRMNDEEKLLFITGPNMAGKSTYLRQNALISILAQTGSFVPATYAEIGLVDKVFSRVGSADNLSRDQSTFMVEMLESAEILKNATERSFVIMDEVGRGTTPEDGIALGYACLEHLVRVNRCRGLFATHFHVLADMTRNLGKVGYWCTDVVEEGGGFSYQHRLRRGVNRESHALKVAKLAGLPAEAIDIAAKVLKELKVSSPNEPFAEHFPTKALPQASET